MDPLGYNLPRSWTWRWGDKKRHKWQCIRESECSSVLLALGCSELPIDMPMQLCISMLGSSCNVIMILIYIYILYIYICFLFNIQTETCKFSTTCMASYIWILSCRYVLMYTGRCTSLRILAMSCWTHDFSCPKKSNHPPSFVMRSPKAKVNQTYPPWN